MKTYVNSNSRIYLCAFILSFAACQQQDRKHSSLREYSIFNSSTNVTKNTSDNLDNSSIRLMFNPPNESQYIYTATNITNIEQEVRETKVESNNETEIKTIYGIEKDSLGNSNITVTYKGFRAKIKAGEVEKEIDVTTAATSSDPMEKIFAAFSGASFKAIVNKQGEVKQLTGLEDISNKMYTLGDGNPQAVQTIQSSVKQYLSNETVKVNLEQQLKVFPSKAVKVGDSWTQKAILGTDMDVPFPVTYTLTDIKDGLGIIEIEGDINFDNQSLQAQGPSVNLTLEGKEEGELQIDIRTGMLINSSLKVTSKGSMQVRGMNIPLELNTKTKIEGKRIK